ncbi:MAG TPA: hypothetical protein VM098_07450, partial [Phycisphaerae bacterium]|nr:hypothetical protein [Phycisphaerae bacterium]
PVRRTLLTRPLVHTEHAIAMIIDDASPLDEDFTSGFQNLAVLRQRNDHLCNTGLPWRIYLLSGLERDDFPVFRAYLLPNCFRLTPRKLELIRQKLMSNGSVVIFGPGTGISDGEKLSARPATGLLGFPLELTEKEFARRVLVYGGSHPALADVRAPVVYGDSYVYGPTLEPAAELAASDAVELGKASIGWYCNRAGLVLKEFGSGAARNRAPAASRPIAAPAIAPSCSPLLCPCPPSFSAPWRSTAAAIPGRISATLSPQTATWSPFTAFGPAVERSTCRAVRGRSTPSPAKPLAGRPRASGAK